MADNYVQQRCRGIRVISWAMHVAVLKWTSAEWQATWQQCRGVVCIVGAKESKQERECVCAYRLALSAMFVAGRGTDI